MSKLDKSSFENQIASLKQAVSVRGKVYHSIQVTDGKVKFIRQGKIKSESIDLDELYDLYCNVSNPTNTEARAYISGHVQSPAVSIINALGNKNNSPSAVESKIEELKKVVKNIPKASTEKQSVSPEKDETKFFIALSEVIGKEYVLSKSIEKPISSSDVFLSDHYKDYGFQETVEKCFDGLLDSLKSNQAFSGKSLSHFIDGLLINHPLLGSRIIEFDEEQHFTPALHSALKAQSKAIDQPFAQYYFGILSDVNYLNDEVLKKHRIKHRFGQFPTSFNAFIEALEKEKISGYIKPKENGFPYIGGRMAQRAYYDCLRNAAHLSPRNNGLLSIIRFPKKYFEDESGSTFKSIEKEQLNHVIKSYLSKVYAIDLIKN